MGGEALPVKSKDIEEDPDPYEYHIPKGQFYYPETARIIRSEGRIRDGFWAKPGVAGSARVRGIIPRARTSMVPAAQKRPRPSSPRPRVSCRRSPSAMA